MNLTEIPLNVFSWKQVEILNLDNNLIQCIPTSISKLSNLQTLSLSNNHIKRLPSSLVTLKKLRSLNLSNNELAEWPEWIGSEMPQILELYLHGNKRIECMPASFKCLVNLKKFGFDWYYYFFLAYNPLAENKGIIGLTISLCNNFQSHWIDFHTFSTHLEKHFGDMQEYPLHLSCKLGNHFVTRYFLENDFDINAVNAEGNTALSLAIIYRNEKCAQLLLTSPKVNVNIPSNNYPLLIAISTYQLSLAETLLSSNTLNASISDANGNTPLHLLFEAFNCAPIKISKICNKLISWPNYNLNKLNSYRMTAAHLAAMKRQKHAIRSVSYTHLTLPTICSV
eukprot:TRINITY_DN2611_c0_g2_i5.p1 TRINITY_DN2611_c0_g2~~TRINITY_DN2611_c0_g2_i5.p1  ORF type:complete len:339 (-),score=25.01 TRINITY_DN2611_c0_g2_i5:46-1062(-)